MAEKTIPNWVEVGTLAVAVLTLTVSGIAASFAWRLDNVERQLLEFQASSEILHRLIVASASGSCALGNRLRVQENDVWTSFRNGHCSGEDQNPTGQRVAGLSIELRGGEDSVFIPRPNLAFGTVDETNGQVINEISYSGSPTDESLGFVEDGSTVDLFIPLAVVDEAGIVTSDEVIWPVSLSWESPVTGRLLDVELNWFAPRDQWQIYDGLHWAQ